MKTILKKILACALLAALLLTSGTVALASGFESSAGYKMMKESLIEVYGEDTAFNYDDENKLFTAVFVAPEGTAFTLSAYKEVARETWDSFTDSIRVISENGAALFKAEGYNVSMAIIMLNDQSTDRVLYSCLNGIEINNAIDE